MVFPVSAISITKLNAVPDVSLNISPTKPSITGNPGASPAPRSIIPAEFIMYPSIRRPNAPKSNRMSEIIINLL